MEPIICNLGALVPEPDFLRGVRRLCTRYRNELMFFRTGGTNPLMDTTIEERVASLEKKVEQLARAIEPDLIWREGWESTIGMSANDPGFDEMVRLGAEYRESLRRNPDAPNSGQ
jgi:hypothetical protein